MSPFQRIQEAFTQPNKFLRSRNEIAAGGEQREKDLDGTQTQFSVQETEPPEVPVPNQTPGHDPGWLRAWKVARKFLSFIGPGMMVSIAYMDPGNYSTDVAGGSLKQYRLLFVILLSTVIALYLQTLAIKLGSVTGKDLARNCREHLPKYVGYVLYIFAEAAILATDVAEIAGTAIALNILFKIPLIAGVFITIADVLIVLVAWGPTKGMLAVHILEYFIGILLMAIIVCFCVLLAKIPPANVGLVFKGFLPSNALITGGGIQAASGILGATVMPHSLYLGSATVLPRVLAHDVKQGFEKSSSEDQTANLYRPSSNAIRATLRYSIAELALALLTVAMFVNSAILIVAGDTLYKNEEAQNADLYELYDMLKLYLSQAAATLFTVALLFSGLSAGVICTLAGQIVSEGHLNWRMRPWIRRVVTRTIAMIPCIAVVASLDKKGLNDALNWSQIVLTITLPFLASPLVYLTSSGKVMRVQVEKYSPEGVIEYAEEKSFKNSWPVSTLGAAICLFIGVCNVYLLVEVGLTGGNS